MKLTNRNAVLIVPFILVLALSVIALPSRAQRIFTAHLSGGEEVPLAMTLAQGQAVFMVDKDRTMIHYLLIAANIKNLFMSHIHLASAGVNGPIAVWLYGSPPAGPDEDLVPGRFDGVLAQGTITAANLVGPLTGQPLSALISAMEAGNAYVNIHTIQYPAGEIRGQI